LRYPDDTIDAGRGYTSADTGSSSRSAGRGYEGIRAVIYIEHCSLGAFEQNPLAPTYRVVQQFRGIAHHRRNALHVFFVLSKNIVVIDGVFDLECLRDSALVGRQFAVQHIESVRIN